METQMTTIPNRFRQLLPAAVVVAALATGANTVAYTAIVTAEAVWDIEEYDYCMRQTGGIPPSPGEDPIEKEEENDRYCCHRSGGVWNGITCATPPAEAQGAALPPKRPDKVGLPTVRVEPPIVGPPNPPFVGPTVLVPATRAG
jgi:hypothetical protein